MAWNLLISLAQYSTGPALVHVNPFEQMPQLGGNQRMAMIGHTLMLHIKIAPSEQVGAPSNGRGLADDLTHCLGRDDMTQ